MAESRDQEPSIEEILASIREIISDDDAAAKPAEPEPAAPPPPPPEPEEDVLDLSAFEKKSALEGINLDKPKSMDVDFTDPEPEPEPAPVPEPITSSLSMVSPAAVIETPVMPSAPMAADESLLTDHAKSASMDSLTRLAQNIAISRAGQGGTLEDIVREMIRPMLRDWLDRNLPPMIERMVERELERLVKEAMNR
ncbi:MAG: DUF2497 domain-containing protein [Alphaproteobacteria bacterium]|nr:DUF2497 domain-containing protein [Alphaproteobacteria bacterium]